MPQQQRVEDNYKALRESILDPEFGDASQLSRALLRIANVAALTVVGDDLVFGSESQKLETLHTCIEFLFGIHSAARACELVTMAP